MRLLIHVHFFEEEVTALLRVLQQAQLPGALSVMDAELQPAAAAVLRLAGLDFSRPAPLHTDLLPAWVVRSWVGMTLPAADERAPMAPKTATRPAPPKPQAPPAPKRSHHKKPPATPPPPPRTASEEPAPPAPSTGDAPAATGRVAGSVTIPHDGRVHGDLDRTP